MASIEIDADMVRVFGAADDTIKRELQVEMKREKEVSSILKLLERREKEVSQKEKLLDKREEEVSSHEKLLERREKKVFKKEMALNKREREALSKEKVIEKREKEVSIKEKQKEETKKEVTRKEKREKAESSNFERQGELEGIFKSEVSSTKKANTFPATGSNKILEKRQTASPMNLIQKKVKIVPQGGVLDTEVPKAVKLEPLTCKICNYQSKSENEWRRHMLHDTC